MADGLRTAQAAKNYNISTTFPVADAKRIAMQEQQLNIFGGDALRGHTRSHPEHDGEDLGGRWYYAGDGMGEQVAAGIRFKSMKI